MPMDKSNTRLLEKKIIDLLLVLVLASLVIALYQLHKARERVDQLGGQLASARAAQLAGESRLLNTTTGNRMIQSGLLAVESAKYGASLEADQALRNYLDLAALPIAKVSHGDLVNSMLVAYSRNGRYIASGGGGTVNIWDPQTGNIVATMSKDPFRNKLVDDIRNLAFSPDGRYIAISGWAGATVWEIDSEREILSLSPISTDILLAFRPDSRSIVWSSGNLIHVRYLQSERETLSIAFEGKINFLMFSPDGKTIIAANDREIHIWDAHSGSEILKLNSFGEVSNVTLSTDGSSIAAVGADYYVRAWDTKTGRQIFVESDELNGRVNDIAISPDGHYIALGTERGVAQIWDMRYQKKVVQVSHNSAVTSLVFSPDGDSVVSNSGDGLVRMWDVRSGREIARFPDASITSIAFSPDGKYLATGGCERVILLPNSYSCTGIARVWEVATGGRIVDIDPSHNQYIPSMMSSPQNQNYLLTGSDGAVKIWDIRNGLEVRHIQVAHESNVVNAIFSPNGQYIVTRSTADKVVRVWDVQSGREIAGMTHDDDVTAMAFSPDSRYVASGSIDGVVIVWEANTGRTVSFMLEGGLFKFVLFSPDGQYVASVDPGKPSQGFISYADQATIHIWEASSGRKVLDILSLTLPTAIAFSPDSRYIAFASAPNIRQKDFNGIVSIRELPSGVEVASYSHPTDIYALLFTSNSKYLITGSGNTYNRYGTIVLWNMQARMETGRILSGGSISNLALSPDNRYLVAGFHTDIVGGSTYRIWDLQSNRPLMEVEGEMTNNPSAITQGRVLRSKTEIAQFGYTNGHQVIFSQNGRYILATGCELGHALSCNSGHIFVLYWRVEDLAAEACRRLPRNFTRAEWVQYFPNEEYRATCPNLPLESVSTP